MWTRYLTVPMAALQSYGMIAILRSSQLGILSGVTPIQLASMITIITSGTVIFNVDWRTNIRKKILVMVFH